MSRTSITLRLSLAALAAFTALPALADTPAACTAPGELVIEDAAGDDLLAPTGEGFADIVDLHIGQPDAANVVFTYKIADLATLPPDTVWMIRFQLDEVPADHDEYFVAMLTGPDATVHFVHGVDAPADGPGGAGPALFEPSGELAGSSYDADGTIHLVLPRATFPGLLEPDRAIFGLIPVTHRITPTDGTVPFAYGFRAVSSVTLDYDEAADGFYSVIDPANCGGKSGAKALLDPTFAGVPGPAALLVLALGALARRRRRR